MENLFGRKYIVQGLFITVALILLGKLFYIQVVSDKYFLSANNNVLRKIYVYPARGVILDRNHKVIVQNEPVYDLMVTPKEVKPFDTLDLCRTIGIDMEGFKKRFKKATAQSIYQRSIFEKQLSVQVYASLQEKLARFPGFDVQKRTVRFYPDSVGGQLFGYIKEVSPKNIEKSKGYYRRGDYIGKSGIELYYEELLRGERGVENRIYDVRNVYQGSYSEGKFDTAAVSGDRLISSIDIRIQKLGEELMNNKVGSIVALEPSTGEVLAFISSPGYDPNKMVGRNQGNNYMELLANPYRVFNVRPIQGYYPPGSSFKPVDALVALQEGVIDPNTTFFCPGGYRAGNHWVKCEHVDGSISLRRGIAKSCNTYFCYIFQKLITKNGMQAQHQTYDEWHDKIKKFGFGQKLDIDLPYEREGIFYPAEYFNKRYGKYWGYTTVISQAIGQGETSATPLQMANVMAAIANRGYYYKPHLIKAIGDKNIVKKEYTVKNYVGVDAKHFEPVIDGMQDVVNQGDGTAYASRLANIIMCGKTGTVQNPHGKNHSVFIGFAPRDNPKIAIAVIVENGGYGSSYAAPIASYMIEKYLTDSLTRKSQVEWMINQNLLPAIIDKTKKIKPALKTDSANKKSDSLTKKTKPTINLKPLKPTKLKNEAATR